MTDWNVVLERAYRGTDTADWRDIACELANVAAEMVTVARVVADARPNDFTHALLGNAAAGVERVVERVELAARRESHV